MILGNGPTKNKGLRLAKVHGLDVWATNTHINQNGGVAMPIENLKLLFQVHDRNVIDVRFADFYKQFPVKCPVVLVGAPSMEKHFPTSVMFPIHDYVSKFPYSRLIVDNPDAVADDLGYGEGMPLKQYHACSMSYMVALAAMLGIYGKIFVYGVDFDHRLRHESTFEKGCVESHITAALQMDPQLQVQIPADSWLFATHENIRQVYGKELNPPLTREENHRLWRI
jgi:hypothetical protein